MATSFKCPVPNCTFGFNCRDGATGNGARALCALCTGLEEHRSKTTVSAGSQPNGAVEYEKFRQESSQHDDKVADLQKKLDAANSGRAKAASDSNWTLASELKKARDQAESVLRAAISEKETSLERLAGSLVPCIIAQSDPRLLLQKEYDEVKKAITAAIGDYDMATAHSLIVRSKEIIELLSAPSSAQLKKSQIEDRLSVLGRVQVSLKSEMEILSAQMKVTGISKNFKEAYANEDYEACDELERLEQEHRAVLEHLTTDVPRPPPLSTFDDIDNFSVIGPLPKDPEDKMASFLAYEVCLNEALANEHEALKKISNEAPRETAGPSAPMGRDGLVSSIQGHPKLGSGTPAGQSQSTDQSFMPANVERPGRKEQIDAADQAQSDASKREAILNSTMKVFADLVESNMASQDAASFRLAASFLDFKEKVMAAEGQRKAGLRRGNSNTPLPFIPAPIREALSAVKTKEASAAIAFLSTSWNSDDGSTRPWQGSKAKDKEGAKQFQKKRPQRPSNGAPNTHTNHTQTSEARPPHNGLAAALARAVSGGRGGFKFNLVSFASVQRFGPLVDTSVSPDGQSIDFKPFSPLIVEANYSTGEKQGVIAPVYLEEGGMLKSNWPGDQSIYVVINGPKKIFGIFQGNYVTDIMPLTSGYNGARSRKCGTYVDAVAFMHALVLGKSPNRRFLKHIFPCLGLGRDTRAVLDNFAKLIAALSKTANDTEKKVIKDARDALQAALSLSASSDDVESDSSSEDSNSNDGSSSTSTNGSSAKKPGSSSGAVSGEPMPVQTVGPSTTNASPSKEQANSSNGGKGGGKGVKLAGSPVKNAGSYKGGTSQLAKPASDSAWNASSSEQETASTEAKAGSSSVTASALSVQEDSSRKGGKKNKKKKRAAQNKGGISEGGKGQNTATATAEKKAGTDALPAALAVVGKSIDNEGSISKSVGCSSKISSSSSSSSSCSSSSGSSSSGSSSSDSGDDGAISFNCDSRGNIVHSELGESNKSSSGNHASSAESAERTKTGNADMGTNVLRASNELAALMKNMEQASNLFPVGDILFSVSAVDGHVDGTGQQVSNYSDVQSLIDEGDGRLHIFSPKQQATDACAMVAASVQADARKAAEKGRHISSEACKRALDPVNVLALQARIHNQDIGVGSTVIVFDSPGNDDKDLVNTFHKHYGKIREVTSTGFKIHLVGEIAFFGHTSQLKYRPFVDTDFPPVHLPTHSVFMAPSEDIVVDEFRHSGEIKEMAQFFNPKLLLNDDHFLYWDQFLERLTDLYVNFSKSDSEVSAVFIVNTLASYTSFEESRGIGHWITFTVLIRNKRLPISKATDEAITASTKDVAAPNSESGEKAAPAVQDDATDAVAAPVEKTASSEGVVAAPTPDVEASTETAVLSNEDAVAEAATAPAEETAPSEGEAASPVNVVVAEKVAPDAAADAKRVFFNYLSILPHGVLGQQMTIGNTLLDVAPSPADVPGCCFVDPAGLHHIQNLNGGPSGAGGAAGAIYKAIGIDQEQAFPDDVVTAVANTSDAKYHKYVKATSGGGGSVEVHVIHAVGPDLRKDADPVNEPGVPYTREQAVAALGGTYRNILCEFLSSGKPTLRLLPVSGGIFAGAFTSEIPALTWEALRTGFSLVSADQREVLSEKSLGMCVFNEAELADYQLALAVYADDATRKVQGNTTHSNTQVTMRSALDDLKVAQDVSLLGETLRKEYLRAAGHWGSSPRRFIKPSDVTGTFKSHIKKLERHVLQIMLGGSQGCLAARFEAVAASTGKDKESKAPLTGDSNSVEDESIIAAPTHQSAGSPLGKSVPVDAAKAPQGELSVVQVVETTMPAGVGFEIANEAVGAPSVGESTALPGAPTRLVEKTKEKCQTKAAEFSNSAHATEVPDSRRSLRSTSQTVGPIQDSLAASSKSFTLEDVPLLSDREIKAELTKRGLKVDGDMTRRAARLTEALRDGQ